MEKTVNLAWLEANVPCSAACPVGTQAGRYVAAIAEGRYREAYELARRPNPFASVCGRVCAAPCEKACRRGKIDQPVAIRALKRFVTERCGVESLTRIDRLESALASRRPSGPMVAVIGAGPAGLSCAHDLELQGYQVTVFEREPVPGGMMRLGIPEHRLPRELVLLEVHAIEALGVGIRYGQALGRDFRLSDLFNSGYEAVFVGMGAQDGRRLDIPGINADGVHQAIDLLRRTRLGERIALGEKVLVVGGGDVAFDAARTALREEESAPVASDIISALDVARSAVRFGARQVDVICLEGPREMPASPEEISEATHEGIHIHHCWGPESVRTSGGRVKGLAAREVLSVFDENGRFGPKWGEARRDFPADTLVVAIGQRPSLDVFTPDDRLDRLPNGLLRVDLPTLSTTNPRVFAGGDAAFGPRILIDAVADGRRAAASIHRLLSGQDGREADARVEVRDLGSFARELGYEQGQRTPVPLLSLEQRSANLPLELGFSEAEARREAERCLHCWINTVFEGVDESECLLCNGCADICPEQCIHLLPVEDLSGFLLETTAAAECVMQPVAGVNDLPGGTWVALVKDEERCIRCGLCARRCPVGVITMESFQRCT